MRTFFLTFLLAGCNPLVCGENTVVWHDVCVGEQPLDLADELEDLEACTPRIAGDELDVERGCVQGACVGDPVSAALERIGAPGVCGTQPDSDIMRCRFSAIPDLAFQARAVPGAIPPKPDPSAPILLFEISGNYDGASPSGLGIGIPIACFLDELGEPSAVITGPVDDEWAVGAATWDDLGVSVFDTSGSDSVVSADGRVDLVRMFVPGAR